MASAGQINEALLARLNQLPYYQEPWPKSLANTFTTETVLPLLAETGLSVSGTLRTYIEHIAIQVADAVARLLSQDDSAPGKMLVTGGGAFNRLLITRLRERLEPLAVEIVVPEAETIKFKEALIMALLGVLRWREHVTALPSVTGAARASIGGALWMGQPG